jgi:hypothetical protein
LIEHKLKHVCKQIIIVSNINKKRIKEEGESENSQATTYTSDRGSVCPCADSLVHHLHPEAAKITLDHLLYCLQCITPRPRPSGLVGVATENGFYHLVITTSLVDQAVNITGLDMIAVSLGQTKLQASSHVLRYPAKAITARPPA